MPTGLKASWTVRCGLWPGEIESMRRRSKAWYYTSEEYAVDVEATKGETPGPHPDKPDTIFQTRRKEATAYWEALNDPGQLNWAELTFTWY